MSGRGEVLVIMGAGAGKSLLFMLPAMSVPSGLTVVIVPLIALRLDMKRRCDAMHLAAADWDSSQPADGVSTVLVTPESALTSSFGRFLAQHRTHDRLDRIVIDKCHVLLDAERGWRNSILHMRNLLYHEVPLTCLTATLPPRDMPLP